MIKSDRMIIIEIFVTLLIGIVTTNAAIEDGWAFVGNPLVFAYPCNGTKDVTARFETGRPPGEENQYNLFFNKALPSYSRASLKFDSDATVTLRDPDKARIETIGQTFYITFFKEAESLGVEVKGPETGTVPYVQSFVVNTVEYCKHPVPGVFDSVIVGNQPTASVSLTLPDSSCGRRKVQHTELIVNGLPTKPGDWPWHVALYRFDGISLTYICGGTLISKTVVLTAAHCVTIRGAPVLPGIINVVLGKFNLVGGDIAAEEREVHEIIVHEGFDYKKLNNDIAVLKLKSEAVFNDYIQPACIWYTNAPKKLPPGDVFGTVVGWGFDQTDQLSSQLQQVRMPIVGESTCIKSNPLFFSRLLNPQKFCGGYNNGTAACNGDSGGGFLVFVPDVSRSTLVNATGTWHVRGIVSSSVSRSDRPICDPNHYGLYTDVAKFSKWIAKYMK